jgi:hypothetical protein
MPIFMRANRSVLRLGRSRGRSKYTDLEAAVPPYHRLMPEGGTLRRAVAQRGGGSAGRVGSLSSLSRASAL